MDETTPIAPDNAARTMIIEAAALRIGVPAAIAVAIARTESGLNRFAMRVEPGYRYLWDVANNAPFDLGNDRSDSRVPPKRFVGMPGAHAGTEWIGQQTSWGCMQVMGAIARELGHRGYFTELCQTDIGAEYGCRLLARYRDRYYKAAGWRGVIASYNAGAPRTDQRGLYLNQVYVDRVLANGAAVAV